MGSYEDIIGLKSHTKKKWGDDLPPNIDTEDKFSVQSVVPDSTDDGSIIPDGNANLPDVGSHLPERSTILKNQGVNVGNVSEGGNELVVANNTRGSTGNQVPSYAEMYRILNPRKQLSDEDLQREKKRETSRALISAVGDGISALSNLYFTTKGVPSVEGHGNLSERNKGRYERMVASRQARGDEWRKGLMDAAYKDLGNRLADRKMDKQLEAQNEQLRMKLDATAKEKQEARAFEIMKLNANLSFKEAMAQAEREFKGKQNELDRQNRRGIADTGNLIKREQLDLNRQKNNRQTINHFNREHGDEVIIRAGSSNYPIGSKTLATNIGVLVNDILQDYINENLGGVDNGKDQTLNKMKRELNTRNVEPKRLSNVVAMYLDGSPTAQRTLEALSGDYVAKKKNVSGSGGASSGGGESNGMGNVGNMKGKKVIEGFSPVVQARESVPAKKKIEGF